LILTSWDIQVEFTQIYHIHTLERLHTYAVCNGLATGRTADLTQNLRSQKGKPPDPEIVTALNPRKDPQKETSLKIAK